jgi:hypothetical protein
LEFAVGRIGISHARDLPQRVGDVNQLLAGELFGQDRRMPKPMESSASPI